MKNSTENSVVIFEQESNVKRIKDYLLNEKELNVLGVFLNFDDFKNAHIDYAELYVIRFYTEYYQGIDLITKIKEITAKRFSNFLIVADYISKQSQEQLYKNGVTSIYLNEDDDYAGLNEKMHYLLNRAHIDYAYINDPDLDFEIMKILHDIGVPAHILGYEYLIEAIHRVYFNRDYLKAMTKQLYPDIAEMKKTTASRVERAIRHAIEVSWKRANPDSIQEIFSYSIDYQKNRPTNSEFIGMITDKIRMDHSVQRKFDYL